MPKKAESVSHALGIWDSPKSTSATDVLPSLAFLTEHGGSMDSREMHRLITKIAVSLGSIASSLEEIKVSVNEKDGIFAANVTPERWEPSGYEYRNRNDSGT